MHSVRGFLQFHASFPTKINFANKGDHGTYRNVSRTYRNVIGKAICRPGGGSALDVVLGTFAGGLHRMCWNPQVGTYRNV